MLNPTFLENKVKRQIKYNGQKFVFKRYKFDKYHQQTDEEEEEFEIEGIFHTTNSYVNVTVEDGAKTVSKPQPMILTLFSQAEQLQKNDKVVINEETYIINDITNVNAFNIACDISLEVMKDE